MNHKFNFFAYLIVLACVAGVSIATSITDGKVDDNPILDRSSPTTVFAQAQKLNETGNYREILKLNSPLSKASALLGFLMQISLLPEPQTLHLAPVAKKWKQELENYLNQQERAESPETNLPMILALAKWTELDECLGDIVAVESNKPRPSWSDELQNLDVEATRAKAEVHLRINDGYLGLLTGNPLEQRDTGKVDIYFHKIADSWFLSNLEEWQGSFD